MSPPKLAKKTGKTALVSGGSSGIGLEITRQLAKHGAIVTIMGRRQQVLDEAQAALKALGLRIAGVQGDVRSAEDCERAAEAASGPSGRLDILVNCAAGNFLAPAETLSANGFRTVMEIDALGTFNLSRSAYPFLKKASAPSIINISATLHYGATWYQVHASAAKAAVDSITRTLALEWGRDGIRVNGVAPGPIAGTAGLTKLAPGAEKEIVQEIPLGRVGEKWDIAMACVYLAGVGSRFVTGHVLVADGAQWMYRKPILPPDEVVKAARAIESKSRKVGTAASSAAAPRSKL